MLLEGYQITVVPQTISMGTNNIVSDSNLIIFFVILI